MSENTPIKPYPPGSPEFNLIRDRLMRLVMQRNDLLEFAEVALNELARTRGNEDIVRSTLEQAGHQLLGRIRKEEWDFVNQMTNPPPPPQEPADA